MNINHFDAVVLGAGPAGSITALTLARGSAHVARPDKAQFLRDTAWGDLIGPRGVELLPKLGVRVEATRMVHGAPILVELKRLRSHDAVWEMTVTTSCYSEEATCVPFLANRALGRPGDGWPPSMPAVNRRPAVRTDVTRTETRA